MSCMHLRAVMCCAVRAAPPCLSPRPRTAVRSRTLTRTAHTRCAVTACERQPSREVRPTSWCDAAPRSDPTPSLSARCHDLRTVADGTLRGPSCGRTVEPGIVSFNAAVTTFDKAAQSRWALPRLAVKCGRTVERYRLFIPVSTREVVAQSRLALDSWPSSATARSITIPSTSRRCPGLREGSPVQRHSICWPRRSSPIPSHSTPLSRLPRRRPSRGWRSACSPR